MKRVALGWVLILILVSVVIGGVLTSYLFREPKQKSGQSLASIPEKVIPDQILVFLDKAGNEIASLDAGGGECSVMNIGARVLAWADGHASILIKGSYKTILADQAEKAKRVASQPRSKSIEEFIKRARKEKVQESPKQEQPLSWEDLRGMDIILYPSAPLQITAYWRDHDPEFLHKDFRALESQGFWARLLNRTKTSKPRIKSVADIIQTGHLRLIDRNGWRFATLGLTASGDPAIAFTDKKGEVRVAWVQRHGLIPGEPDWYDLAVYDSNALRVSIEVRPGNPLDLTILDNIGTHYGFDLSENKFILKQDGLSQFPELDGLLDLKPQRPIALFDDGGIQFWKAPVISGQQVSTPTILPSKIEVMDDASMRPSERQVVASPKGDMRPFYRVVGRLRNNSVVEIEEVHLRISILDGSRKEVDGADISLRIPIPPGATRAFDQEIQVLPPPKFTWSCEVISAIPKK